MPHINTKIISDLYLEIIDMEEVRKGLCTGLSMMYVEMNLQGENDKFYRILRILGQNSWFLGEECKDFRVSLKLAKIYIDAIWAPDDLKCESKLILDAHDFLRKVLIYQGNIERKKGSTNPTFSNHFRFLPKELQFQSCFLHCVFRDLIYFKKDTILNQVKKIFGMLQSLTKPNKKECLTLLIRNCSHVVALRFSPENNRFFFYDQNQAELQSFSAELLPDMLIKAFGIVLAGKSISESFKKIAEIGLTLGVEAYTVLHYLNAVELPAHSLNPIIHLYLQQCLRHDLKFYKVLELRLLCPKELLKSYDPNFSPDKNWSQSEYIRNLSIEKEMALVKCIVEWAIAIYISQEKHRQVYEPFLKGMEKYYCLSLHAADNWKGVEIGNVDADNLRPIVIAYESGDQLSTLQMLGQTEEPLKKFDRFIDDYVSNHRANAFLRSRVLKIFLSDKRTSFDDTSLLKLRDFAARNNEREILALVENRLLKKATLEV